MRNRILGAALVGCVCLGADLAAASSFSARHFSAEQRARQSRSILFRNLLPSELEEYRAIALAAVERFEAAGHELPRIRRRLESDDWRPALSLGKKFWSHARAEYERNALPGDDDGGTPPVVPEPATGGLLLLGLAALTARRRAAREDATT